jgi:hypothetical protein
VRVSVTSRVDVGHLNRVRRRDVAHGGGVWGRNNTAGFRLRRKTAHWVEPVRGTNQATCEKKARKEPENETFFGFHNVGSLARAEGSIDTAEYWISSSQNSGLGGFPSQLYTGDAAHVVLLNKPSQGTI